MILAVCLLPPCVCFSWVLFVFAQAVDFADITQNGSGSRNKAAVPHWRPKKRIYFLDPIGGLGSDHLEACSAAGSSAVEVPDCQSSLHPGAGV